MKPIRTLLIGIFIGGGLIVGLHLLHAQETATSALSQQAVNSMSDTEVMLQAIESAPPASATTAPRSGTFWSAQHAPGSRYAWPPLPSDNGLPVWNLGDGVYLLDDLQVNYDLSSSMAGGMMTPDDFGLPGGGTNGGNVPLLTPPVYTTNDLWLQMDGITNTTAYLTIHPPWAVTNEVYDLYYTTNLTAPATWSWVLRSFAGLTNLAVNNATDAQGFYRLGPLNDPIGNSSQGTNFWVAFMNMYYYPGSYNDPPIPTTLSLYISSPVGASGTMSYFIPVFTNGGYNATNVITTNFTVAAGMVTNVSIPSDVMFNAGYDDLVSAFTYHGIHVTASQPVSVYGMDYAQTASTAFTGYPTTLLGTNYCLMAYIGVYTGGASEFAVVATEDNTTVNIALSPLADPDGGTNWTAPIILQHGQTYELGSVNQFDIRDDDMTGTIISSDKPIAVFAGSQYTLVPSRLTESANPMEQEHMPVESWGTMALGLSFAGRTNGDCYRVLAAYSNTVVTITGTVVTVVNDRYDLSPCPVTKTNEMVVTNLVAGQFCDIIVEGPVEFQATSPFRWPNSPMG